MFQSNLSVHNNSDIGQKQEQNRSKDDCSSSYCASS